MARILFSAPDIAQGRELGIVLAGIVVGTERGPVANVQETSQRPTTDLFVGGHQNRATSADHVNPLCIEDVEILVRFPPGDGKDVEYVDDGSGEDGITVGTVQFANGLPEAANGLRVMGGSVNQQGLWLWAAGSRQAMCHVECGKGEDAVHEIAVAEGDARHNILPNLADPGRRGQAYTC